MQHHSILQSSEVPQSTVSHDTTFVKTAAT